MSRVVFEFEKFKEKIEEKKQKKKCAEEEAKIRNERTCLEYDWKDWKELFDMYSDYVYGSSKGFMTSEETDEWFWKIFTHQIRELIDINEEDYGAEERKRFEDLLKERFSNY